MIAHDLIHGITPGCIKMTKHVGLPLAVKDITSSRKVVTLLNRYGLGLSVSQVQEAEASMAQELLE